MDVRIDANNGWHVSETRNLPRRPHWRIAQWVAQIEQQLVMLLGPFGLSAIKFFLRAFAVTFVIGLLFVTSVHPQYEATAILVPQAPLESGSLTSGSGLSNGLAGLAPLIGVTNGENNNLLAFQELLTTAGLAGDLIKQESFERAIWPDLRLHRSFLGVALRKLLGEPTDDLVSVSDMQNYISNNIYAQKSSNSEDFIKFSYPNKDRATAVKILQQVIYSADKILRQREAASLDRQIHYLTHVIETNTDIEQRNLLRQLLGSKLASKVLLDTQETYAFKIFDAPFVPTVPTSPNITMLLVFAIVFSLLLAATFTVGWWWLYGHASRRADDH